MKILNVNMSMDPVRGGGTAERTQQMSLYLAKKEIECSILTTDTGLNAEYIKNIESSGVKIYALPTINSRFYLPGYGCSNKITNLIQQADIIHIMNHWTILNVMVYIAIRKLNKPYVICPAGSLQIYGRSKLSKKAYNWLAGNKIVKNAISHIAVTSDEINQFFSYGVRPESIHIIPNGINTEDYLESNDEELRSKYRLGNDPFIMFIGRLNHIKGPDLLLQAFCKIKDKLKGYHLVFAGPDGGMLSELKNKSEEMKIADRVHFTGYLGGEEKSSAYRAASLLAIPSRQEAMSIVVLEAGIMGTPVLLTDQCGFDEVERIGGGKVVSASVKGLQNGLIEILKDKGTLKSMGANLKRHVIDNYTWERIINKYIDLYNQILSNKK